MSFGFSIGDVVAAAQFASHLCHTVYSRQATSEFSQELDAFTLQLRELTKTLRALDRECLQDKFTTRIMCEHHGSRVVEHCLENTCCCGIKPDKRTSLRAVLAEMQGCLYEIQKKTQSWEEQNLIRNHKPSKSSAAVSNALTDYVRTVRAKSTMPGLEYSGSRKDIQQLSFGTDRPVNYDGCHLQLILHAAIEQCSKLNDHLSVATTQCIELSAREKRGSHELSISTWKSHKDSVICDNGNAGLSNLSVLAVCSVGGSLLHWTLLKSLHLEPHNLFDERVLRHLDFLVSWIRAFEPHRIAALVLFLLSCSIHVITAFTVAARTCKSERTSILVSCWLTLICLGALKTLLGFSTTEYFLVLLPVCLSSGTCAGILLCRNWMRLLGHRNSGFGRHSIWANAKDSVLLSRFTCNGGDAFEFCGHRRLGRHGQDHDEGIEEWASDPRHEKMEV